MLAYALAGESDEDADRKIPYIGAGQAVALADDLEVPVVGVVGQQVGRSLANRLGLVVCGFGPSVDSCIGAMVSP